MKKMKGKDGGVLVMVMVVMLAFSVLAIGLFKLHDTDALETVYVKQGAEAFWVAETGLQHALSRLRIDKDHREDIVDHYDISSPYVETDTVANIGVYTNEVWYDNATFKFVIQSGGTVRRAQRLLQLKVELSDFGKFGLAVLDGIITSEMGKDSEINGDVYMNGDFDDGGIDIDGTVFSSNADDNDSWEFIPEDGMLDLSIKTDSFLPKFDLPNQGVATDPLKLSNTTLVVSTSLNVSTIEGPGTIVVKGNQTFSKDLAIGDNVAIIVEGNLTIRKNATLGNGVTLFSGGYIDLFKKATATVNSGDGCAILALGNMKMWKDFNFDGIIFTEKDLYADKDLNVSGTIITRDGFDMKKNASVTFDAGLIPASADNMITTINFVKSSMWTELPVN